jgi:cold shock protein
MVGGKVRFYDYTKRVGTIVPDDGSADVFVHATALERAGVHDLTEGQSVRYEAKLDDLTGRLAVGVLEVGVPSHEAASGLSRPEGPAEEMRKPRVHRQSA